MSSRLIARLAAGVLLALTGITFWASVVGAPPALTVGRAAAPWPDGAEYLDGAVLLHRQGVHGIHVAGRTHPSRYPFGFSMVSSLFLFGGGDPAWAPHRANQLGGLILLALTASFWWRRIGPVAAALATLLLATLPAFVILCRSPLSDVWGTVLAVSGIWCLYAYACGGSRAIGMTGAALLAASLWFRTSNLLLAPFGVAAVFARYGSLRGDSAKTGMIRAGRDLARFGSAAVLGIVPLWIQNVRGLGDALATGYGYWVPYWDAGRAFQLNFVLPRLAYLVRELLQAETVFTTANLFGHGSYVGPAFVLLAACGALGLGRRCRDSTRGPFVAAASFYLLIMLTYFVSDARLLFPLLVLSTPVAAAGWMALGQRKNGASRLRRTVHAIATGLLLAALAGWPSARLFSSAGEGATGGRSQLKLETVALWQDDPVASPAYRLIRQLQRLHEPAPRLVLSDIPSPYVHAMLPEGTWAAPLTENHYFRFNPEVFDFGVAQQQVLVHEALVESRSVWAVVHEGDVGAIGEMCAPPDGFTWEVVTREPYGTGGIARLVQSVSPQGDPP